MLRELLRFLWTAFIDHWALWVTGTGAVGLGLWALNWYERFKGTPMKPRTNALVLFCVFWFLGTFAAWHDADVNLEKHKQQITQQASILDSCKGDLRAESGRAAILDSQLREAQKTFNAQSRTLAAEQQTMNSQQGVMNSQQTAMNSCVVALGKANTPEPQKTTLAILAGDNPNDSKHRKFFLAFTNKPMPTPIRGIFACEHETKKIEIHILGAGLLSGGASRIDAHSSFWNISTPAWTPAAPIVFIVSYDEDELGGCGFELQ